MNLDPALAAGLFALAVAIIGVLVLLRGRQRAERWQQGLAELGQRLDQHGQAMARSSQRLEERILNHERVRKGDHAALTLDLEHRLGGALQRQGAAQAQLRQDLTERFSAFKETVAHQLSQGRTHTVRALSEVKEHTGHRLSAHQARFEQRQGEALKALNETLHHGMEITRTQVSDALARSHTEMGQRVDQLTRRTDRRLEEISGQVEKRLSDGFEKTTATFSDVVKRLALIDEAQKKITELSSNVVSLQQILSDKRSRGAFGEVQLGALVSNVLPSGSYALQHTLGNGRRADCVLFLPPPTGTIAIDSKFPLESYQTMTDFDIGELERKAAQRQFKLDMRAHIKAISERYIIQGETSDGAVMFIPAEAVFAEIQAHHADVVQEAQRARVWMASPTTLIAILNTARAVLKDEATRRQIHVIRQHLSDLAMDFDRFRDRMDKLALHIDQANRDVGQVHISARKISDRFDTIEKVEMEGDPLPATSRDPREDGDGDTDTSATGSG